MNHKENKKKAKCSSERAERPTTHTHKTKKKKTRADTENEMPVANSESMECEVSERI